MIGLRFRTVCETRTSRLRPAFRWSFRGLVARLVPRFRWQISSTAARYLAKHTRWVYFGESGRVALGVKREGV